METTRPMRNALIAVPFLFLAACGQASTQTRGDQPMIAMATPPTDSPGVYRAALEPAPPVARLPDEVLHDPAQKFEVMERLRTRIVAETRQVPEPRWSNEVRPVLKRQLSDAGLSASDVSFLLTEVDAARAPAR
jgi:hypothetical protein